MAHAEAEVQDNLEAVVDLIGSLHRGNIQWYTTLNNSTSTRPKDHGGINVQSTGKLRSFQPLARFTAMISKKLWRGHARLRLPPAIPVRCPQSAPQPLARFASMISAKLRRGHALSAEHECGAQASRVDGVA